MENRKPHSRKKKSLGIKGWAAIGGGAVAAAALITTITYAQVGKKYEKVFFPNTTVNGIDASKKSVEEVKRIITSDVDSYVLSIKERGGVSEELKGQDIGLETLFDGSLEALLAEQKPLQWMKHLKKPQDLKIDTMIKYDEDKLAAAVESLSALDEEKAEKPEDAHISDYTPGQGYSIVPAKEGNTTDPEKTKEGIAQAVEELKPEVYLEELGAYLKPGVPSDDPQLLEAVQTLNKYVNTVVTYQFGGETKVLNGETISKWAKVGEDGKAYLDSSSVAAYVKELAAKYDTFTSAKTLKTSYGQNVRITGGVYGWKINQSAEADELAELIRSGESQTREPVYKQKAASRGANDYGNTYVEVNLTAQHLYFYKDGKLVVDSDFVSGNESRGWSTPAGTYSLTYKERDATLKGENYRTPVSYWMPFNGNIGFHDASWRSSFGGSLYKTGGSHGCINLPPAVAKTLYENINAGIPVLCYHLAGTETKKTSNAAGETAAETTAAPTTAAPTTAAPTTAAPTTAAPTTAAPATEAPTAPEGPGASTTEAGSRQPGPGSFATSGTRRVGPGGVD